MQFLNYVLTVLHLNIIYFRCNQNYQAAANFSVYSTLLVTNAQDIRANLLASATMATLGCFFSLNLFSFPWLLFAFTQSSRIVVTAAAERCCGGLARTSCIRCVACPSARGVLHVERFGFVLFSVLFPQKKQNSKPNSDERIETDEWNETSRFKTRAKK